MKMQLTRIVSTQGPLTKRLFLDESGKLQKKAAAQLYRGQYDVASVSGLADLGVMLEQAGPETAFTYGVPDQPAGLIVREEDIAQNPLAIARTRHFFKWPNGPGILMIDDDSGLDVDDYPEFLRETVNVLDGVEMLTCPSSSSWVRNSETGNWVTMSKGRHTYVIVSDARMIPEVGKLIEAYLWLNGHGYFDISRSGRLLKRCPADTSVWQPERLDFVGGAVCTPPLIQRDLRAVLSEGYLAMVDTRSLPKLSDRDKAKIQQMEQQARLLVEDERQQVLREYLASRTDELVKRGVAQDVAQATVQAAIDGQTLSADFVLTLQDGTAVTVGEMLVDPDKYDGKRCHDPLEPDYRDDPRVAYISLKNGGRPQIYSHAHGGCRYLLRKPAKTIQIFTGESAKGTDEIARHLSEEGILYERGQLLVTLQENGETREVKPPAVKYLAGTHCNLVRLDGRTNNLRSTDLPDSIAQLLVTRTGHGVFRPLTAVITAPTMTPRGRLIVSPGYDHDTGLLLIAQGELSPPPVPTRPNGQAIRSAFDQLWHPFKDFPFDGDDSRSAMLAALLTAVVRPCLKTSPGFGFDAPTAGSGKTKLAQCVAALATGCSEALLPPPSDDEETRKKITTALAATKQVMIFDNVEAQLRSPVLAAFVTASTWSDRMLGGNTELQADNRILLLLTGNNLVPVGDIVRRLLMVRIDPQLEASQVWQREFALEPLDYVIRNRQRVVAAALTMLAGYVAAGMPRMGKGRLASFEEWDDMVRQCIIWLGRQGIGNLVDPVKRLNDAVSNDPESLRLGTLAASWHTQFGSASQLLKDVIDRLALQDVLKEVAQDRRGMINTKMLAAYLAKRIGKIVNGFRFERINGRANTSLWRVVQMLGGDGGCGGFDGADSAHATHNKNSADIFSRSAETNPSNPPQPPERPEEVVADDDSGLDHDAEES